MQDYKKVVIDVERKFKVMEVLIPNRDSRSFRELPDSKQNLIEVGKQTESYGTVLGHALGLKDFGHISGSSKYDRRSGEGHWAFMQSSLCRTCLFLVTTAHIAFMRLYFKKDILKYPISYLCQVVHFFYKKDVDSAELDGKGIRREVSSAATSEEKRKNGQGYDVKQRRACAPWWYPHFPFEESAIFKKEDSVKTKVLFILDPPGSILSATELMFDAELCDGLEKYPDLTLVVKLTGTDKPFHKSGFNTSVDEETGYRSIASGEGDITFYSDTMARVVLQLSKEGLM